MGYGYPIVMRGVLRMSFRPPIRSTCQPYLKSSLSIHRPIPRVGTVALLKPKVDCTFQGCFIMNPMLRIPRAFIGSGCSFLGLGDASIYGTRTSTSVFPRPNLLRTPVSESLQELCLEPRNPPGRFFWTFGPTDTFLNGKQGKKCQH